MEIIDISRDILTAPVYEGDPEPKMKRLLSIENGDGCNLSVLYACVHNGTHADAKSHFIEGGAAIDEMPPDAYIGPCLVMEFAGDMFSGETVEKYVPGGCERLLIKSGSKAFVQESAVCELKNKGVRLIGIDSLSIAHELEESKTHRALFNSDIAVLENLYLDNVKPGKYFLIAPPLKIGGADGAPVRALLINDYIFWGGRP